MTKLSKVLLLTGASLAIGIACIPPADDDDDDFAVNAGTYDLSNAAVVQDECEFAGLPTQVEIEAPNGPNGDAFIGSIGTTTAEKIPLQRNANNFTGFEESNFDHNTDTPPFNCLEKQTVNWDGVIIAVDTIKFTLTNFWDHQTPANPAGTDQACLDATNVAGGTVAVWPCETIESFDITLP